MSRVSLAPLEIREASIEAVAAGIERYLPASIGILVIGIPICALTAFVHFVLGVSTPVTAGAGTITAAVLQIVRSIRPR
jgi:hypothetical protein